MSRTQSSFIRKAAFAGLSAFCVTSIAFAQTSAPATGLGQAWPNATDVSASPNFHAYVFVLNGIKYIQINDLNGTVHVAVGTANGTTIVLPVGVDSQNVTTSSSSTTTNSSSTTSSVSSTQTVYQDTATTVTATPQSNGSTTFNVVNADSCPTAGCSGNGGP